MLPLIHKFSQLAVSSRSEQTQNNPAIQDKDQNMSTSYSIRNAIYVLLHLTR